MEAGGGGGSSSSSSSSSSSGSVGGGGGGVGVKGEWGAKKTSDELNVTAAQAEQLQRRREAKEANKQSFGLHTSLTDAKVRAYEKKIDRLPSYATHQDMTDDFAYGGSKVGKAGAERVGQAIADQERAREKADLKRHLSSIDPESTTIDHVNDKNAAFNKKVKRSFDKYTLEIRQSIERGTAL